MSGECRRSACCHISPLFGEIATSRLSLGSRAIDLARPAGANRGDDFVRAEPRTWSTRHRERGNLIARP